jgi:DNA gyrase subunit A
MIITKAGILIRTSVAELRVMGRNTQGVKLIRLKNDSDEISSVTKIEKEPEPEEVEVLEGVELTENVDPSSEVTEAPKGGEGTASEAPAEDVTEE